MDKFWPIKGARFITPLQSDLKELRKDGFQKVAAISYAKAKSEIGSAKNVVQATPRDHELIESAVKDARFELSHVRNVANEVKLLSSVENKKFETIILEFENKL